MGCAATAASAQAGSARLPAQGSVRDEHALQQALDAYDRGDASAGPQLRSLVTRHPQNFAATEALGSLYAEGGDLTRALPLLKHAVALQPAQAIAHANLGAAYLKLSRGTEAVAELKRAVALDATNLPAKSNLGHAYMLAHQYREAAAAYAAASALAPTEAELRYNQALALFNGGDYASAADVLAAISPADLTGEMRLLAADADERSGRYGEALQQYQAAAKADPSDANLYALTLELLRHWTWPEAAKVANYGAQLYPASHHFPIAAGIAYYAAADYKSAVHVFSSLLSAEPQNAMVADLLGRSCSLLEEGTDSGCSGIFDYAMQHRQSPILTTYAAVALLHGSQTAGDLDRAAALLQDAIHAAPDYPDAYFQLGVLEQRRSHWSESAAALQKTIELRPDYPEAHYRLSRVYAKLGRTKDAEAEMLLHQQYSSAAKKTLDARLQEVMRFVLSPS